MPLLAIAKVRMHSARDLTRDSRVASRDYPKAWSNLRKISLIEFARVLCAFVYLQVTRSTHTNTVHIIHYTTILLYGNITVQCTTLRCSSPPIVALHLVFIRLEEPGNSHSSNGTSTLLYSHEHVDQA